MRAVETIWGDIHDQGDNTLIECLHCISDYQTGVNTRSDRGGQLTCHIQSIVTQLETVDLG